MMTINRTGSENKDFQDLIHKLDMNLAGKDNLEQWTKEWSCNKCILETGNKMFEVIAPNITKAGTGKSTYKTQMENKEKYTALINTISKYINLHTIPFQKDERAMYV